MIVKTNSIQELNRKGEHRVIYVENNVINLTRGDDAVLTVPLKDLNGREREIGSQEYLIFGLKETPTEESEMLLELRSADGENTIEFSHSDTNNLEVGFYSAEIQLMTQDGKRITVWPKLTGSNKISKANRKNFCLMTEVVYT